MSRLQSGREIIFCSIGQCGVQAGNSAWELFCMEHNVRADGKPHEWMPEDNFEVKCLFNTTEKNRCVPRAIIADLEPTVVDEIRTGAYRQLFHPGSIINSVEDAASNYARGYFTTGKSIINNVLHQTRQAVEVCDHFNSFFMIHSVGGGTGAGFTNLYLEHLDNSYAKKDRICVQLLPSQYNSTSIVEPYNVVLANHGLSEHADVVIVFDNHSLYRLCQKRLQLSRPGYNQINRIIAHVYSDMTCCYRFESPLTSDLTCMQTNLVPYPRIHFIGASYSPLMSVGACDRTNLTVKEMTRDTFQPGTMMCDFEFEEGFFMSCSMQYRGAVGASEVNDAIHDIKMNGNAKFVDWNPTGFKIGLTTKVSVSAPNSYVSVGNKSLTMLANSTSIHSLWNKIKQKFTYMYAKKAFVHWYVGEGLEEAEFKDSLEQIESLIKTYKDLELGGKETDYHVPQPPSPALCSSKQSNASPASSRQVSPARSQASSRKASSSKQSVSRGKNASAVLSTKRTPSRAATLSPNPVMLVSPPYDTIVQSLKLGQDAAQKIPSPLPRSKTSTSATQHHSDSEKSSPDEQSNHDQLSDDNEASTESY